MDDQSRKGAPEPRMDGAPGETPVIGSPPGWIILVRHGRPQCDQKVRITWQEYIAWWQAYDAAGLDPGQTPPDELVGQAQQAHVIFSSTLRRAVETARAIAPGRDIQSDPIFVEASLPPPPIPGRRKPRRWGVYSRIAWWFGRSAGMEPRPMAERRAEAAAAALTARALRGENVVLCAHGWFNRMMRPVLLGWGWKCVYDGGDKYWSHRRYEKR
jgi:broad specificity phosphatase PhoE